MTSNLQHTRRKAPRKQDKGLSNDLYFQKNVEASHKGKFTQLRNLRVKERIEGHKQEENNKKARTKQEQRTTQNN